LRPPPDLRPIIHSSVPGQQPGTAPLDGDTRDYGVALLPNDDNGPNNGAVSEIEHRLRPVASRQSSDASFKLRRFHMSRADLADIPNLSGGGVSKKNRYSNAVFIEKGRADKVRKLQQVLDATPIQLPNESAHSTEVEVIDRPLKKPGATSRTGPRQALPPSMAKPFEDPEKLAAEMDAWTMDMIRQNLQSIEQSNQKPHRTSPHKFRPKAPAQRLADRDPELAHKLDEVKQDVVMTDASDTDEGEWVVEEYIRVPAETLPETIEPGAVGVLVLGTDEEIQFFYGPDNDSDDGWAEDDEDENGGLTICSWHVF
jgi:Transcription factor Iwr1